MAEDYVLDRGSAEPQRNIGYLIHPSIAPRLGPSSRIADVGTGTGIFLVDLSHQLPNTSQLDGFDISDALFPPPTKLPANVTLRLQDARHPFPPTLHHTYDLVNIKLMVAGLDKDDWAMVAANLAQLLKPGGAIQWAEADFLRSAYSRGDSPDALPGTLVYVNRRFHEGIGHRFRYGYSTLPTIFQENGLSGVFQDVVASDRISETREAMTVVSFDGIWGWAQRRCIENVAGAWSLEEIAELKEKVREEARAGCYFKFDIYVTIGVA